MMSTSKNRKNFLLTAKMVLNLYLIYSEQSNSKYFLWELNNTKITFVGSQKVVMYIVQSDHYNLIKHANYYQFRFCIAGVPHMIKIFTDDDV